MPSLLLVTATFAPSRMIGGRRPERMAEHLVRHGWQVTVLTLKPAYMKPIDASLQVDPRIEVLATHALMPRTALRLARDTWLPRRKGTAPLPQPASAPAQRQTGVLASALSTVKSVAARSEFPDEWIGWVPLALAAVRGRHFDVVLGTMPPFTDAVLARLLAQRCGARLVLDYRDPWSEVFALPHPGQPPVDAATRKRHRALEDRCLAAADLVLGVSPTLCEWLRARCRCDVAFVPNAIDAAPTPLQREAADRLPARIVYAGSLAYGRDLLPIVQAMAALRPATTAHDLQLVYAGSHGAGLRAQAQALGVADAVVDLGEVPAARALELLDGAIAAPVIVAPGWEYTYPGKIFHVMAREAPVLLLAEPHADASALVRRHQLGWSCAPGDVPAVVRALREALAGRAPQPVDLDLLSAATVMADFQGRLEQLLAKGP